MITRVHIKGYKSLGDVNLPLKRLTIILGHNAAGKSNLFDALRLLSHIVTSRSLADAFAQHRGDPLEAFDYSEGGVSRLLEKERAEFTIEVDVELSDEIRQSVEEIIQRYRSPNGSGNHKSKQKKVTERFLRYRISVEIVPKTGVLRVADEHLEALTRSADGSLRPNAKRRPFLERVGNRLRLRIEGQARPMEYEIGLNYALASQPLYPPHYPHLTAFREEVSRWQFYYFEPHLMREESPIKESYQPAPTGGDLPAFYFTLKRKKPEQFENLQLNLRMLIPAIQGVDAVLTDEGKVRLVVQERGVEFSAKVISEGTLRVLALLAIFSPQNPSTVIGIEEPENGVHPRRLKLIANLLDLASRHRQVLINTHSNLLPDYLRGAYLVRCRKENGHSTFAPLEEAEGIFRAPQVDRALEDEEKRVSLAQQILRGDWG